MRRTRSLTSSAAVAAVVSLTLGACGGSSSDSASESSAPDTATEVTEPTATEPPATDPPPTEPPATDPPETDPPPTEPPATDPPTTDAAPTTDFVLGADSVKSEFADGFVSMDIWPGWELGESRETVAAVWDDIDAEPWSFNADAAMPVVSLSSGDAFLALFRESRYGSVPSYDDYRASVNAFFSEQGTLKLSGPNEWAGLDGDFASYSFGSVRTAQVDDQYVALVSVGASDGDLFEQVTAMTESIDFDTDVIGPLAHGRNMEFFSSAAGPEFAASVIVPFYWVQQDGDSLGFVDPLTGSNASITLTPTQGGVDGMVAVIASTDLIDGEPVRVDGTVNDLPYAVLWQGEPSESTRAIIVADDGVYGSTVLVETAVQLVGEDPAGGRLIEQIVASIYYGPHSLTG